MTTPGAAGSNAGRVAVAIATRNRRDELLDVVGRLVALPDRPEVIVADNASTDGSADAVAATFPDVRVLRLARNLGCAARNVAATATTWPYVAFADDDSWWAPGALDRAADYFDAYPQLGLLAARILVGPDERLDPVCTEMTDSGLARDPALPGMPTLGFVACGAVVRRSAFLAAGGFTERFVIGGEENLLSWDLAAAGWGQSYVEDVVAHHHPSKARNVHARRRRLARNDLWTTWMRRPLPVAAGATLRAARGAVDDPVARRGLIDAAAGAGWALGRRRVLPRAVECNLRTIQS